MNNELQIFSVIKVSICPINARWDMSPPLFERTGINGEKYQEGSIH